MTQLVRFAALSLVLLASILLPAVSQAKPRVVTTLADLWAITSEIVGDQLEIQLATHFGQNPHDLEIRPSQILMIKRADILVRNGLEEDAWIDPIVESSGNPKLLRGSPNVVEAVLWIQVLKVPRGQIDRSLGDVHPLGNPHYDFDPRNLPLMTANIVAGLSRVQPDLAPTFEANRNAFLERVAVAYARWRRTLAPYKGAGLVLIRTMKERQCRVILHESYYPTDISDFVAQQTGARRLIIPQIPGALPGARSYFEWMDNLVNSIANALK